MSNAQTSFDSAALDLDRHAVIEASAGTGKTYCIERIVVRLLREKGVRLDQLLVVTFTDKATGELRQRLRKAIEQELALDCAADERARLERALDEFDSASISTIHGFCLSVLRQHAFENRQPLGLLQARERDLLLSRLRERQRTYWPELLARHPGLLGLSGYDKVRGSTNHWEVRVLRVAANYREQAKDQLRPAAAASFEAFEKLDRQLTEYVQNLRELLGPFDPEQPEASAFVLGFQQLKMNASSRKSKLAKLVLPLFRLVLWDRKEGSLAVALRNFLEASEDKTLDSNWNKGTRNVDMCPNFDAVHKIVQELAACRTALDELQQQLAVHTVKEVQSDVEAFKAEQGVCGFDDMLTRVHEALQGPGAEALLAALRGRYRYAVVDEFQDTDRIQWSIFERIFMGEGEQRLFVVGDPKQAIYSFRGADLHAYHEARTEILSRLKKQGTNAEAHRLEVNFRARPELIAALNHVFSYAEDWFEGSYQPVQAPCAELLRTRLATDRTDRAPLTAVALEGFQNASRARTGMASFVAQECRRLLALDRGAPLLVLQHHGETRPLRADDVAVLVQTRREAENVLGMLRAANLPCSLYKKQGVWQSEEALHIAVLLEVLAHPLDLSGLRKALLTRFVGVPLVHLELYQELPLTHPLWVRLETWRALAVKRRWPAFFQALLEESGVLAREIGQPDGDRRVANYLQLAEMLQRAALAEGLDALALAERAQDLRATAPLSDETEHVHRIETERPKIQVMTIHAAKGLEFPIVFVAGGFTRKDPPGEPYKYHENGRIVFDLRTDVEAHVQEKHNTERTQELQRLYYVAFTRAMYKLYVPLYSAKRQSNAPVPSFVKNALDKALAAAPPSEVLHKIIYGPGAEPGTAPIWQVVPDAKSEGTGHGKPQADSGRFEPEGDLFPEQGLDFTRRRTVLTSFTALSRQQPRAKEEVRYGEATAREEDEAAAVGGAVLLPHGVDTGILLHSLLERVDFKALCSTESMEHLLRDESPLRRRLDVELARLSQWNRFAVAQQHALRREVVGLLRNTLQTPLAEAGGMLGTLAPQDRRHEVEFLLPWPETAKRSMPQVEDFSTRERFLNGAMDLIFRRAGRYFLADWKTNYLVRGYDPAQLRLAMDQHGYGLQLHLYAMALCAWLRRIRGTAFQYEHDFGGVYYLFLRGVNGVDESSGVYFQRPASEADMHAFLEPWR